MKNNLICDPNTGVCGVGDEEEMEVIDLNQPQKTIDVYYVTDPMCSHCWAIEPVLRRFRKQYGHYFRFHTVMGGLLEKWGDGPVDPANGIYGPADVTKHWREVGEQTRMPIDGSLMQDNPVQSSYPASRVFKVIQNMHGDDVASTYLRRTREAVFAFNRNISDKEVLVKIVDDMGLEGEKIVTQAEEPSAQKLLNEDFQQARNLGAMGFPSILMINEEKKGIKIVGGRPLDAYIQGLKQVLGVNELEPKEQPTLTELLAEEELLFSKEIEVMYDVDQTNIASFIDEHLNSEQYDENELLGEKYIQIK
ncbi:MULTISPECIES: DsbA family protein [Allobacillus]|uniref:DsbA family protein n=1 Tax=Allobacillus halotolerans TaxID=570278 RepID=A0ABS6GNZ0_9BACI|nr:MULTISPECIES: DsbA family protein [Allobacillus]MBU6080788.1 DsbA family protein [Allobacillus halotolerans]TSJ65766.1 DsbA family protein [Allobacillus sp. SKP2-8]